MKFAPMKHVYSVLLSVASLSATLTAFAATDQCDDRLTASLHECERIVGSLRPDKASQQRVYASDGSEFTAGQAQWMKSQLKLIGAACDQGRADEANRRLADVQELLAKHHRAV